MVDVAEWYVKLDKAVDAFALAVLELDKWDHARFGRDNEHRERVLTEHARAKRELATARENLLAMVRDPRMPGSAMVVGHVQELVAEGDKLQERKNQ